VSAFANCGRAVVHPGQLWAKERTRYRGSALRAGPEPVAPTE